MELKVKTINGQDHQINLEQLQPTLGNLRDVVRQETGVPNDRQKFIYRGKVLTGDEKKLSEFCLSDGNVLHMVERSSVAPSDRPLEPHPDMRRGAQGQQGGVRSRNIILGNVPIQIQSNSDADHLREVVQSTLGRLGEIGRNAEVDVDTVDGNTRVNIHMRSPEQRSYDSPALDRVANARRILGQTNHILFHIERDVIPTVERHERQRMGDEEGQAMETDRSCCPDETSRDDGRESNSNDQEDPTVNSGATHHQAGHIGSTAIGDCADQAHETDRPSSPPRQGSAAEQHIQVNDNPVIMRHATVSDLHQLLSSIFAIQERIAPLMRRYHEMLANERSYAHSHCEGRHVATFFNSMQTVLHNLSHVFHAASDMSIHLCESPPRRLYPQFNDFNVVDPTEANISLSFSGRGNVGDGTGGSQASFQARPNAPGFRVAPPQMFRPPLHVGRARRPPFDVRPPPPFPQGAQRFSGGVQLSMGPNGQVMFGQLPNNQPFGSRMSFRGPTAPGQRAPPGLHAFRMPSPRPQPTPNNEMPGGLHNFLGGMLQNALGGIFRRSVPNQPSPPSQPQVAPQATSSSNEQQNSGGRDQQATGPGLRMASAFEQGGGSRVVHTQSAVPLRQSTELGGRQALFVGPRPPVDLPLFTMDPFLPCSSRHYDPRIRIREQQNRGDSAGEASQQSQQPTAAPIPTVRTNQQGQAVFDSDEQFVSFLEHIFRSVIGNMVDNSTSVNPSAEPRQLFAYEPMMSQQGGQFPVVTGTISVETMANPQEEENLADHEHEEENEDSERDEAAGGPQNEIMEIFNQMVANGPNRPIGQVLRNLGENPSDNERGYNHLMGAVIGETMGVVDVITIFNGDRSPIDRMRHQIRNYLVVNLLNGNDRPSEQDLESAATRATADESDVREVLRNADDGSEVASLTDSDGRAVDVVRTAVAIDRSAITRSLRTVFGFDPPRADDGSGISFGDALVNIMMNYCREMVYLLNAIYGHPHGYETVIRHYLAESSEGTADAVRSWMGGVGLQQMRTIIDNLGHLSESDVRHRLVYTDPESVDSAVVKDSARQPSENTQKQSVSSAQEAQSTTDQIPDQAAKHPSSSERDPSWRQVLPKDWTEVMEKDANKQKTSEPQSAFSDAYLSGMPAKRRKKIAHDESRLGAGASGETSLKEVLREAVKEAEVESMSVEHCDELMDAEQISSQLLQAFENQVDREIGRRVVSDSDCDAEKNPATNQYFRKS